MAYESKVSRKYFGSTFAGRVQPEKETQLKQLSKSLASVSPQLANMGTNYALGKKQDAVNELNLLRAQGKSAEEINAIILKGDNTALSNMYSENVVQAHNGRFAAADTINKIIESQKSGDYDYTTMNLQDFYSPFVTEHQLDNQSTNYQTGFAAVFNKFAAEQKIKDADDKGKYYQQQKLDNVEKLLSPAIINIEDIHDSEKGLVATANTFGTSLPNVDGKPSQYLSNQETNAVLLSVIEKTINGAQRGEEGIKVLEWADSALDVNLGKGKGGNQLGTLFERSDKAQELRAKLRAKMVRLENQQRTDEKNQEQDDIQNLFADYLDKDDPTLQDFEDMKESLVRFGDPTLIANANAIFTQNRFTNNDPAAQDTFLARAATGGFSDVNDLVEYMKREDIPTDNLGTAISYHNTFKDKAKKNALPESMTNSIYTNITTKIADAVKESYRNGQFSYRKGHELAELRATLFIRRSIAQFEAETLAKGKGAPTNKERTKFMEELSESVVLMHGDLENPKPKGQDSTFLDIERKAVKEQKEIDKQNEATRIRNEGLISSATEKVNTFAVPDDFELPTFEKPKYKVESFVIKEENKFRQEELLPSLEGVVRQMIDSETISEAFGTMNTQQALEYITNIADRLNVQPKDIKQVFKNMGVE